VSQRCHEEEPLLRAKAAQLCESSVAAAHSDKVAAMQDRLRVLYYSIGVQLWSDLGNPFRLSPLSKSRATELAQGSVFEPDSSAIIEICFRELLAALEESSAWLLRHEYEPVFGQENRPMMLPEASKRQQAAGAKPLVVVRPR